MEDYRFELLNDTNILDLPGLFQDAFNENRSIEYIRGKYDAKKLECERFTFLAYDHTNSPAGLYAIFPLFITVDGEKVLAGQVGDILIHSAHRKCRDLFSNLANHSHEYALKKGMKFIFAFLYGTKGSYPALVRYMDFVDDELFKGYNLKVKTLPLSNLSKKNAFVRFFYKPYFKVVKHLVFIKRAEFLYNKKDVGYGEIVKDLNFINYKKGYSSCEILETKNVRFLLKINNDGSLGVGDVDKVNLQEINRAIKRLKRIAFFLGIRILQFEISTGHLLDQVLQKECNFIKNRRVIYLNLDQNFPCEKIKFTFSELDTY